MDIDISDLKSREIIKVLTLYPQGHLEIKFERVFWSSDYAEPSLPRENPDAPAFDNRRPVQNTANNASKAFGRMADTLGALTYGR